jgi:hypothetical protein
MVLPHFFFISIPESVDARSSTPLQSRVILLERGKDDWEPYSLVEAVQRREVSIYLSYSVIPDLERTKEIRWHRYYQAPNYRIGWCR